MGIISKILTAFENFASGLFLIIGLGLMFVEAVLRYVFNSPTVWINETASVLVVWGILFGLSVALRDNHHISVDIFYAILPEKLQKYVNIFANVVGIIFCIFIVLTGIELVIHTYESKQVTMDTRWPMWIYYLVLPISAFTFMIRFIERLLQAIKSGEYITERGHQNDRHNVV